MYQKTLDPGNIHTRRDQLALDHYDPRIDAETRAAAARTVRRVALDDADAAELLAMLGLDQHPARVLPLTGPPTGKERR